MFIKLENESVVVTSQGIEIIRLYNFPVFELKEQLRNWLGSVTEENSTCFIFQSLDEANIGIFRIEPRPNGWQFTSVQEFKRSGELLSLDEWRELLKDVI